jgi:hypothetical protein
LHWVLQIPDPIFLAEYYFIVHLGWLQNQANQAAQLLGVNPRINVRERLIIIRGKVS